MIAYIALAISLASSAASLVMIVRGARTLRRLDPQRPYPSLAAMRYDAPDPEGVARLEAYTARAFANARGDDAPPPSTWDWSASAHDDAPPPPRDW